MNTNALKAQMALQGINVRTLCGMTGINESSFYRKIGGKVEFTQGEISEIAKALKMSKETIFAVFFAAEVS